MRGVLLKMNERLLFRCRELDGLTEPHVARSLIISLVVM